MDLHRGAAGHRAADVLMVGHGHHIAHQGLLEEHRSGHGEVRQVGAAGVGVVDGVHVAGLRHPIRIGCSEAAAELRQHPQVDGNGHRLGSGAALAVEHRRGRIKGFRDDGGVGALENDELHFFRHAVQLAAQHLQSDRIHRRRRGLCAHEVLPALAGDPNKRSKWAPGKGWVSFETLQVNATETISPMVAQDQGLPASRCNHRAA